MFHDPKSGKALDGKIPLILAGHTHARAVRVVDKTTLLMVEGSTGGAGLRGTEKRNVVPLEASALYFSRTTHRLIAWDDITEGGLGQTEVTIERHSNPLA